MAEPKPSVDEMVSAVQEKMLREREIKYRFVFEVMVDNVQSFTRIYKIVEMTEKAAHEHMADICANGCVEIKVNKKIMYPACRIIRVEAERFEAVA